MSVISLEIAGKRVAQVEAPSDQAYATAARILLEIQTGTCDPLWALALGSLRNDRKSVAARIDDSGEGVETEPEPETSFDLLVNALADAFSDSYRRDQSYMQRLNLFEGEIEKAIRIATGHTATVTLDRV